MNRNLTILTAILLAACSEEQPPRTATEFVENPVLLEAAMVRCSQNRDATRYDAECVNAREAVRIVEAREEAERKAELERQSAAKREALRRTQRAAAEARRRAAEAERRRREADYLAQFGVPMPPEGEGSDESLSGNTPTAVLPAPPAEDELADYGEALPASDGGNAPAIEAETGDDEPQ